MRYFCGSRTLGTVESLPQETFAEFCSQVLERPMVLSLTREAFHELPKKDKSAPMDQTRAKTVAYFTPAAFQTATSHRSYETATVCNLIVLDIDPDKKTGSTEIAQRLIQPGALDPLIRFGYIAWHTASSTAEAPRLRILVNAEAVPVTRYRDAVAFISSLLGLPKANSESQVAVQAMFLPTIFAGEEHSPIIAKETDGTPFTVEDLPPGPVTELPEEDDAPVTIANLENYREPVQNTSIEQIEDALKHIDPDVGMHQWIEIAAALKHQLGEDGYQIWDTWSARGKKYVDAEETAYRWSTLKSQTTDRIPITIRTLFKYATEAGWSQDALIKKRYEELLEWLKAEARSTEELLDKAPAKIAHASIGLGLIEQKNLLVQLRDVLKARQMPMSIADIRAAVKREERETAKAKGFPHWTTNICYVTSSNCFYLQEQGRIYKPEVVDLLFPTMPMGESQPMRAKEFLVKVAGIPQVENLRYDPAKGGRFFSGDDGLPYVNTYTPSKIQSDASRSTEAGELIQRHLANLIKEPEYVRTMIDFMAYLFQAPGSKINWAPLIQSTKGTGKTFLAWMLSRLLGPRNVKKVSNANLMESTHNEWVTGAQLAVLDEIRVVGQNRHAVMDKLKFAITDDEVPVRSMYLAPQTVPNTQNYLLFTNHHDAIAIQDDERRYFVVISPLQRPEQVDALGGAEYFTNLFDHVNENPGGLKHFFENWTISSDFRPRGRAPHSQYLRELVNNSASPLAAAMSQAIEDCPRPLVQRDLVSMGELRAVLDPSVTRDFSDQAMSAVLRELGWVKYNRVMLEGTRHNLWTKGHVKNPTQLAIQRLEVL